MNKLWSYPRPTSIQNLVGIFCHERSAVNPEGMTYVMNLRRAIFDKLEDQNTPKTVDDMLKYVEEYFNTWMIFSTTIENERKNFMTLGIFFSEWKLPSNANRSFIQKCFRFETIMAGLLYASFLFNKSVREKELNYEKKGDWTKTILRSYSVLKNVCLDNIINWNIRREEELPFECTLNGCKALIGMCMIELQHCSIHYADVKLSNKKQVFRLNFWLYKKIDEIRNEIMCRIKDKTIVNHSWAITSTCYRYEAVAHMYYNYACFLSEDDENSTEENEDTERIKRAHYLLEMSMKMLEFCEKDANSWGLFKNTTQSVTFTMRIEEFKKDIIKRTKDLKSTLDSRYINTMFEDTKKVQDARKFFSKDWLEPIFYKQIRTMMEENFDYIVIDTEQNMRLKMNALFYY